MSAAFSLSSPSVEPRPVLPGDYVAYRTAVGGGPRGRWVRALAIYVRDGVLVALDEEDDVVHLRTWHLCSRRPPVLRPAVLASWLRTINYYELSRARTAAEREMQRRGR